MAKTAKKKTTRKASKKTVTKAVKTSNGSRLNDETIIKVVTAENPFRENSVQSGYFDMAKKCKTAGEFKKKYPNKENQARAYLRWLVNRGDVKTVAA